MSEAARTYLARNLFRFTIGVLAGYMVGLAVLSV